MSEPSTGTETSWAKSCINAALIIEINKFGKMWVHNFKESI